MYCSKHYPSENTRYHYRLSWFYVTLLTPECVSTTSTWPRFSLIVPPLPPMSGWRWPWGTCHRMCSKPTGDVWNSGIHPFLMRLAKKLWWEVLKHQKWWASCGFLPDSYSLKFEYFMQIHGNFYEKAFLTSVICLTWIIQPLELWREYIGINPGKLLTFISRLFLAAVSPVFQKTFYGSLGKSFFLLTKHLKNFENTNE